MKNEILFNLCTRVFSQADTSVWEREIDLRVNRFYGQKCDEVLLVDPKTRSTQEDYERLSNGYNEE